MHTHLCIVNSHPAICVSSITPTCTHTHLCTHVWFHTLAFEYTHCLPHAKSFTQIFHTQVSMHAWACRIHEYMYAHMYIHVYGSLCIHMHGYAGMHMHIHPCMHLHVHALVWAYAHVQTRAYAHTHAALLPLLFLVNVLQL